MIYTLYCGTHHSVVVALTAAPLLPADGSCGTMLLAVTAFGSLFTVAASCSSPLECGLNGAGLSCTPPLSPAH